MSKKNYVKEIDGITPDHVDCGPGLDIVRLTMLRISRRDMHKD